MSLTKITLSLVVAALTGVAALMPPGSETRADGGPAVAAHADSTAVLAVVTAALEAITREDFVALTDLMVDEAYVYATWVRDGVAGYGARSRDTERDASPTVDIVERGFDAEIRIAGTLASVWLPYDLYVDGEWSHCGVDAFTLVKSGESWRIASLAYSIEQPPACRMHPDGPPN